MPVVSRFLETSRKAAKEKPGVFALYVILCVIVAIVFVRSIFEGRYEHALLCLLVFILFWIPSMLERRFAVEIPSVLEGIILCFIFAAEILGEIDAFYIKIPFWDTILHTTWGFLAAGIGFALVDILNRSHASRLQLAPIYMAITAFCFSMTAGAVWELFEYSMDVFVGFDMQKDAIVTAFSSVTLDPTNTNIAIPVDGIVSTEIMLASGETVVIPDGYLDIGLHDSMADLFVNLVGAAVFSIIGFIYVKNRGSKKSFATHFIPRLRNSAK